MVVLASPHLPPLALAFQHTAASPAQEWWEPDGAPAGITLALISMFAFGSFQNFQKSAGKLNPTHFFLDLCIGQILVGVLVFEVPGRQVLTNTSAMRVLLLLLAGLLHGFANLFLTLGVSLAGLSITFPLTNGLALTLGTLLTYWADHRGRLLFIVLGSGLALAAVLVQSYTHMRLRMDQEGKDQHVPSGKGSAAGAEALLAASKTRDLKALVASLLAGLLIAVRNPLFTSTMQPGSSMSPYFATLLYSLGCALAGAVGNCCLGDFQPDHDGPSYFELAPLRHIWGFASGCLYGFGLACSFLCGEHLGFVLAHCIGKTSCLVAMAWGIFWYWEFAGSSLPTRVWAATAVALYASAVIVLLFSVDS